MMLGALGWVVGGVLGVWFLLSVVAVVERLRPALIRFDPLNLLERWALFEQPLTVDFVLLRRDILRDGNLTAWRELTVGGPRRWYNAVWHPDLRARRAFIGLAQQVARANDAHDGRDRSERGEGTDSAVTFMTSFAYVTMLNYVAERSHPAVEATQFMLVSARELAMDNTEDLGRGSRIRFVSEFHLVERRSVGSVERVPAVSVAQP